MKKLLAVVFIVITLVASAILPAGAEAVPEVNEDTVAVEKAAIEEPDAETKADTIVWLYRSVNGVLQKRRWNETKQCWYDPYWVNA